MTPPSVASRLATFSAHPRRLSPVGLPTSAPAASADPTIACRNWNTKAFFQHVTASAVANCLALGADVLLRDSDGNTPLHWAAWVAKDLSVIHVLLRAGGHLQAPNRHGLQPLQIAAAHHRNPAAITTLVNAGADPRTLTDDGRTTLHLAAQNNVNPAVIDTLLSLGANLMARDKHGNTATDLAARNTNLGVLETLVSAHRRLFRPTIFDVTPFRDENRVFFNVRDRFPTRKESRQYHYSWCQYREHLEYFPDLPRVGECDATDGVEGGRDPILLEAQIGGDVALGHQGAVRALAFAVEQRPPDGKRHSTCWQLYATMVLKLRMMRTVSVPILPPSFMPKVTYQRLGFRKDGPTTATMHATHLVFGHHSNGQTGCPFLGQRQRQGGECVEIPLGAPAGDVNYASGNFSTHYFQVSKYWRWIEFAPTELPTGKTFGAGIEQHLPCKRGIDELSRPVLGKWGTMCHLERRYGKTRLWATVAIDGQRHRFHARGMGIFGGEVRRPLWLEIEYVLRLGDWPDVYVRGYGGQDPYNIRFEEALARFEVGFTFTWENVASALRGI